LGLTAGTIVLLIALLKNKTLKFKREDIGKTALVIFSATLMLVALLLLGSFTSEENNVFRLTLSSMAGAAIYFALTYPLWKKR